MGVECATQRWPGRLLQVAVPHAERGWATLDHDADLDRVVAIALRDQRGPITLGAARPAHRSVQRREGIGHLFGHLELHGQVLARVGAASKEGLGSV
ncbi:MAG: hypothetical protein ACK559_00705, partial [bacterium]